MNLLIVKLSSLGDVVHAMPAVQDLHAAFPQARIDWVVERGFASLVRRCDGVDRVIECELRRWRKAPLSAATRQAWRAFRADLQARAYDAVLDLQGLTKSALVARTARLADGGLRYALANRTEGSSYEAPTRWVADVAVPVTPHIHAVERSRVLCAKALGYAVPAALVHGLKATPVTASPRCVALVHGTSRPDKCWPTAHWVDLGRQLAQAGHTLGLPHGSVAEQATSEEIAAAIGPAAQVWPRMDLGALADRLGACAGVIGVDSGLSHIAVALDRPHVQIYNFDTAWRTGPDSARQRSVYAQPTPSVGQVWDSWHAVEQAR
jgi:heptosyltransferase-1